MSSDCTGQMCARMNNTIKKQQEHVALDSLTLDAIPYCSSVSNGIWNSASKPIQKKEQTACMSYCLIVFTTKEARTLFFFFTI